MEIMLQKRLHKQILPLSLLLLAVVTASVAAYSYFAQPNQASSAELSRSLVQPVWKTSSNDSADTDQNKPTNLGQTNIDSAGKNAKF